MKLLSSLILLLAVTAAGSAVQPKAAAAPAPAPAPAEVKVHRVHPVSDPASGESAAKSAAALRAANREENRYWQLQQRQADARRCEQTCNSCGSDSRCERTQISQSTTSCACVKATAP